MVDFSDGLIAQDPARADLLREIIPELAMESMSDASHLPRCWASYSTYLKNDSLG